MKDNINLIECADHSFAPWSILCVHLIDGTSRDWRHVELDADDLREVDGDWLCPECHKKHQAEEDDIDDLRPICMHCVRFLKRKYGV